MNLARETTARRAERSRLKSTHRVWMLGSTDIPI